MVMYGYILINIILHWKWWFINQRYNKVFPTERILGVWTFESKHYPSYRGPEPVMFHIYCANISRTPLWVICLMVWGSSRVPAAPCACAPCRKGFCCHSVSPDCKCKRIHCLTKTLIQAESTRASYVLELNCLSFYRHTIYKMVCSLWLDKPRWKAMNGFKASV